MSNTKNLSGSLANPPVRIVALVGSYRKGGIMDKVVDEVLLAAQSAGAETLKIYLIDEHIEFCKNCRSCTQMAGDTRGVCTIDDAMDELLELLENADAIIIASPVNFFSVTAVTKRFIERLVCYAYWPWGVPAPKMRNIRKPKQSLLIVSSAAPSFLILPWNHIVKLLKTTAQLLGAEKSKLLKVGLAAKSPEQVVSSKVLRKAHCLGEKLATKS